MISLRPYQSDAKTAIFREWETVDSTLVCFPTGLGKTVLFASVIADVAPRCSLVVAHREELIFQARDKIERVTGLHTEIEMGEYRAQLAGFDHTAAVISTIQTQTAGGDGGGRMARFDPADFGTLIIDEAHHATGSSYRRVIDYYRAGNPGIKILGVTATPDRADEEALGQIFETVAADYEILDAIHDGWLVPIEQQMVKVSGLDFSSVRTTAGDLNGADLAAIMEAEKNLQGIAGASIDIIGQRRAIVFTASVKQAETIAEIFNRHRSGMSAWVCGKTEKEDRRRILADFAAGKIQVVANCGVLTEGFDDAGVELIIMGRPTKSRSLYTQMVGRATRPLPGLVDGPETAEERRAAIAGSAKPSCLVVDFVGNAGRHKLISSADILGGKVSDEAIERAITRARQGGKPVRMDELLDEQEAELREERRRADEARRSRLVARAQYSLQSVNPFDLLQVEPVKPRGWDQGKTLSEKQRALLTKQGIDPDSLPFAQARQLISEIFRRWDSKLATIKQVKTLARFGYANAAQMTMADASRAIDRIAAAGWKRPTPPPPPKLQAV